MIWVSENQEISDEDAEKVEFLFYKARDLSNMGMWLGPLLGGLILIGSLFGIYCVYQRVKTTKKVSTLDTTV